MSTHWGIWFLQPRLHRPGHCAWKLLAPSWHASVCIGIKFHLWCRVILITRLDLADRWENATKILHMMKLQILAFYFLISWWGQTTLFLSKGLSAEITSFGRRSCEDLSHGTERKALPKVNCSRLYRKGLNNEPIPTRPHVIQREQIHSWGKSQAARLREFN